MGTTVDRQSGGCTSSEFEAETEGPARPTEDDPIIGSLQKATCLNVETREAMAAVAATIEDLIQEAPDEVSRQALIDLAATVGVHVATPELSPEELQTLIRALNFG